MRKGLRGAAVGVSALIVAAIASPASAEVRLTISGGQVTLSAKDATVRQILAEWARVGQTKIVNAERVPGGPISLELTNMPEDQALDIILRSVSGYLAAERPAAVANASRFDRILVMPTAVAPSRAPSAAPAAAFPQPQFNPPPMPPEDEDDEPAPPVPPNPANMPPNMQPNQRGPIFNRFPPGVAGPTMAPNPGMPVPQQSEPGVVISPGVATPGYPQPTMPVGVAQPGMVVPAPAPQPGQPGPNGIPPQQDDR